MLILFTWISTATSVLDCKEFPCYASWYLHFLLQNNYYIQIPDLDHSVPAHLHSPEFTFMPHCNINISVQTWKM